MMRISNRAFAEIYTVVSISLLLLLLRGTNTITGEIVLQKNYGHRHHGKTKGITYN